MDERQRRIVENEALYRSINEKIESLNEAFGALAETMAVICECARLECAEQIELEISMYEHVRADPTHFVVLTGHETLDIETIVEQYEGFTIVRKNPGEAAEIARERA
jgi:hypothetical protein